MKRTRMSHGVALVCVLALGGLGCSDDDGPGGNNNVSDAGVDSAVDAEVDAGPPPSTVGDPCWEDSDCPAPGICWTNLDGFPGGFCIIEDCPTNPCPEGSICAPFTDDVTRCIPSCETDADCRQEHGYVCDEYDTCWPGDGTVPPGGPCGADAHCQGGTDAYCLLHSDFPGGYCMITDCTATSCPDGAQCAAIFTSGGTACIPGCVDDATCREGYVCVDNSESDWNDSCFPGCDTDEDCPGPLGCRPSGTFSDTLVCLDVSAECSPDNHTGDCPSGQVCNQGVCEPFSCDDTVLEPNETRAAAETLPATDTYGLQICSGDDDWFSFTPDTANVVYQVGIDSNYASGNLDVELIDAADNSLDDAQITPSDYNDENPVGPTNLQLHSIVGAAGSDPLWLHAFGVSGAVNNYGLIVRQIPWQDGLNCTDYFTETDCRSTYAGGAHDPSQLIVFPLGNAQDSFIGEGVYFDNGLSAFGNPPITFTSTRYGRRELIMAVRNAINAVQTEFPSTAPLSIGEVGMPDGTTPYGHPNGTHYYGANVDIAYYIDPAYHNTAGNLAYRQICCDAPLNDWSCVDTDTSSAEYGTCVAGSESTHIVDLPRTALFVAKLVATGRIRTIGFEAKIQAGFEAALDDLVTDGVITSLERNRAAGALSTANDDGSWIWHFNHMHVSFCSGDCAAFKAGEAPVQGLWPDLPLDVQADLARGYYLQRAR